MRPLRPLAVAAAALLLAACGGSDRPSEEARVRAKLSELRQATAVRDYERLCTRILAPQLVEQVAQIGLPCPLALEQGLGRVEDPQLRIGRVRVTGARAYADVRTSARGQQPSRDIVELMRVDGQWRVSSLAGQGPPAPPRRTP